MGAKAARRLKSNQASPTWQRGTIFVEQYYGETAFVELNPNRTPHKPEDRAAGARHAMVFPNGREAELILHGAAEMKR
jgi:hypothetical protein